MDHHTFGFEWVRQQMSVTTVEPYSQYERYAVRLAHKTFLKMRHRSFWYRLFTRKSTNLLSLQDVLGKRPFMLQQRGTVQLVPVKEIQGSEGKSKEFDREFRPLFEQSHERWVSIALARTLGHMLPPVDLIRVDGIYFVRDGHHRISVAKANGQQEIEANVWDAQIAAFPPQPMFTIEPVASQKISLEPVNNTNFSTLSG